MNTFLRMTIAVLLVSGLFTGCKRRTELTLSPEGASPGMVVRVTSTESAFPDAAAARVEIGGQQAPVVKRVSATEVDVLVPNIAAGDSQVQVTAGKVSGTATFTVLPASTQELVLQLKEAWTTFLRFKLALIQRFGFNEKFRICLSISKPG